MMITTIIFSIVELNDLVDMEDFVDDFTLQVYSSRNVHNIMEGYPILV